MSRDGIVGMLIVEVDGELDPRPILTGILTGHRRYIHQWLKMSHYWKHTEKENHIGNQVFEFIPIEGDIERWVLDVVRGV